MANTNIENVEDGLALDVGDFENAKPHRVSRKRKEAPSFSEVIDRALARKMPVTINGKKKLLMVGEVIWRQQMRNLTKGDLKAQDILLLITSHFAASGELSKVNVIINRNAK